MSNQEHAERIRALFDLELPSLPPTAVNYLRRDEAERIAARDSLAALVSVAEKAEALAEALERVEREVRKLDALLEQVDAAMKREPRDDDPEWVGYYGVATGPWHRVLAQRHHVLAAFHSEATDDQA